LRADAAGQKFELDPEKVQASQTRSAVLWLDQGKSNQIKVKSRLEQSRTKQNKAAACETPALPGLAWEPSSWFDERSNRVERVRADSRQAATIWREKGNMNVAPSGGFALV
jgi:hypothetical protein